MDELRREFRFQNCGWPQLHTPSPVSYCSRHSGRDRSLPLIEAAVECLRAPRIIAPGMTTLERLVWTLQRLAQRRLECPARATVECESGWRMDCCKVDPDLDTDLTELVTRDSGDIPSAKSLSKVFERLAYV